jgi:hypothetical protein
MKHVILLASFVLLVTTNIIGQATFMHVQPAKNPGTAFVMGLFIPGSGQMYNDQVEAGLGVLAVSTGLVLSGASLYSSKEYSNAKSVARTMIVSGGMISFGASVYAAFNSRAINRKNGMGRRGQGSARLIFGPNSEGIGLALRF